VSGLEGCPVEGGRTLRFCYVLAGWEGSAHDGQVLQDAFSKDFYVPKGKYYLGDAGYGLSEQILTLYRGVHYRLRENRLAGQRYEFIFNFIIISLTKFFILYKIHRPSNPEELFNLRHVSLRMTVERDIWRA
jgi:hypothetical protein